MLNDCLKTRRPFVIPKVFRLTPARGARDGQPVSIPWLKAAAQPLELLDYLLEAPVSVPLVNGGATLVNVPDAIAAARTMILRGLAH
jgi:hypothetical protein